MSQKHITENTLFYGNNLFILYEHVASKSVDLIYLDPPFNSNRNYNVLFKDEHGTESEAAEQSRAAGILRYLDRIHTIDQYLEQLERQIGKSRRPLHETLQGRQIIDY